ncbi:MAG TPA: bifunctional diguanylate cyclase/phosphodiesterase, partial [Idiomarina abyssalis]|nr:bifunctional diguanylate cyclase/phosphodiesterase [Idiomarina abyssalis]
MISSGLTSVDDYLFALKKNIKDSEELFQRGDPSVWQKDYVAIEIDVSSGQWILALAPKDNGWAKRDNIYWIIIIAGWTLSFLMIA